MSASPAGYIEPAGEPTILHTICWACWYYVEGRSSMDPVCGMNIASGSHNNRTTCCFHPSAQAVESEAEERRKQNKAREKTRPRQYVTIRIGRAHE